MQQNILNHAEAVCNRSGSHFVKWFSVMPPRLKRAMTVFYAFCREVDDWADDEGLGSPESRRSVLYSIRHDLMGGSPTAKNSHWESVVGVGELMDTYGIPPEPFIQLVDGMLSDLQFRPIRSRKELLQYAYQVASTVGIVCTHFLSPHPKRVEAYAVQQGIALQLTNMARDFREDVAMGRLYVPTDWLGVSPHEVETWLAMPPSDRLLHPLYLQASAYTTRLRDEARGFFELALGSCPLADRIRLWPLLMLGFRYMKLLKTDEGFVHVA